MGCVCVRCVVDSSSLGIHTPGGKGRHGREKERRREGDGYDMHTSSTWV